MSILIYKTIGGSADKDTPSLKKNFLLKLWVPSYYSFLPPLLKKKYILWWFAHYFGIFKNKDYSALSVYHKAQLIGMMVLAPAYSRWKFMGPNDLQITNLFVNPSYRGMGIAYYMIVYAINKYIKDNRTFWYITTDDNIPSIKLCEKSGFQFVGKGIKNNYIGLKGLSKIKLTN
jgi:ribosomal protein S18 acetylase RimI-like enzyme